MTRPRRLICACCGEAAYGRQWWNRDTGYGLCRKCGEWLLTHRPFNRDPMPLDEVEQSYGKRGVHWDVPSPEELADADAAKFQGSGI